MPHSGRRNRVTVRARTREPSLIRVRVPSRWKAPRSLTTVSPFARRHPRGISASVIRCGLSSPTSHRVGDPGARSVPRRAFAASLRGAAQIAFSLSASARDSTCPCKWKVSVSCGHLRIAVRRPSLRQRTIGPTQPASVDAGVQRDESLTRVRRSMARWVCPRVANRLQKSASDTEVQRSALPVGSGARGREPGHAFPQGTPVVKRHR